MSRVLNILLTHQNPEATARVLRWWEDISRPENLLLAHGGREEDFAKIDYPQKIFVSDPRLRRRDHQREKQSHGGVFQAVREWLKAHDGYTHIYYVEFDHLPLVSDLNARQLARLNQEEADVLTHHLSRIDGTSVPHYLCHAADAAFHRYWEKISVRSDRRTVLTAFGSGTFWKREAFMAVADHPEEIEAYMEIYLPTLAHHLGWRIRDYGSPHSDFVWPIAEKRINLARARAVGAWTIHPVKSLS